MHQVHHAERTHEGQGHGDPGDECRRRIAQEDEDDGHDQHDRERQLQLHIVDGRADGHCPVGHGRDHKTCGQSVLDQAGLGEAVAALAVGVRQELLDPVHHGDDVGAGLALDVQDHRRRSEGLAVLATARECGQLGILGGPHDLGDIAEADRRAVPVGDDELLVVAGAAQLIIGVDRIGPGRSLDGPLGAVDIGCGNGRTQGLEAKTVGGQSLRIGLHADGGTLPAGYGDEPDPRQLADARGEAGVRQILDVGRRQHVRRQGQSQHRSVRRIDLGVDRRGRQVGRQEVARRVDRRLHLLLGHVEGQIEPELQRDHRRAVRTDRRHALQARHLSQLPLQRRGHRGGHHLWRRARIEGLHLDGRVIDLGQGRERQELEADHARQEDRHHQQGGGDGPLDEQTRRAETERTAGAVRRLRIGHGRDPPPWSPPLCPPPPAAIFARISASFAF